MSRDGKTPAWPAGPEHHKLDAARVLGLPSSWSTTEPTTIRVAATDIPTGPVDAYFDAYCGQPKSPDNPRGASSYWCWWSDCRQGPGVRCPFGKPGDTLEPSWQRTMLLVKEIRFEAGARVWCADVLAISADEVVARRQAWEAAQR